MNTAMESGGGKEVGEGRKKKNKSECRQKPNNRSI